MSPPYFKLFAVATVVMGLSHTLAKERVCEPIRKRFGGKETWGGYLLSCPYCNSHWFAFLLVPLTGLHHLITITPQWGIVTTVVEGFLSSVFVAIVAAFLRIGFYFIDESQGLLRRETMKTEAEAKIVQNAAARAEAEQAAENGRSSRPSKVSVS